MKFKSLFSSLLLAGSFLAQADEIHLKDGSKVMGTITQIHKNQISVSTKFAGDITIPTDEVTSYTTDKDQNVEFLQEFHRVVDRFPVIFLLEKTSDKLFLQNYFICTESEYNLD